MSRKCPVCGHFDNEKLHTQNFVLPENILLPHSYEIVSCKYCGFVYANTNAVQRDYDNYYARFSKYEDPEISSGGLANKWDKQKFEPIARCMSSFQSLESTILDVGCANGGLLATLKTMGYSKLTGLDPSPTCVSYVNNHHNIKVLQGGIFDLGPELESQTFDLVILSHVLEHICDVQKATDIIVSRINIGGHLYLETPDAGNYSNYPVVPFYYFDCEHINHFDSNSFMNLLEPKGLKLVSMIHKAYPVSNRHLYPAIAAVFEKHESFHEKYQIAYSDAARKSVLEHIQDSEEIVNNTQEIVPGEKQKIIVWGAGSYALRLLGERCLDNRDIVAFVDNDKKKHGQKLAGKTIYSPEFLRNHKYPVMICSALFCQDILQQINDMGLERKVIIPFEEG